MKGWNFLFLFVSVLLPNSIKAQKYSFTVASGYSFPSSKRVLIVIREQQNLQAKYGSYGSGLNFNLGFEKTISKSLSLGFDGSFSLATKQSGKTVSQVLNLDATVKTSSSAFYFIPYLYGEIPTGKKANLFASWGLVLSKPKVNYDYFATNTYGAAQTAILREELIHKFSFGSRFSSGLAFVSGTNSNVTITIGIELITLAPLQSESEITKYTLNGIDQLPSLGSSSKIIYEKNIKTGDPKTALANTSPFGSIGLKLGCKMKLVAKH
jgi:hypothetical protein